MSTFKQSLRGCPICKDREVKLQQKKWVVIPDHASLADAYDVVRCGQCGFVLANTAVSLPGYELFYAGMSRYEDLQTSSVSINTPWNTNQLAVHGVDDAFLVARRGPSM
jgi:hypothetical protein